MSVRVLVVDDSAFARKVVRDVLTSAAGIEVVGIARDGLDALEQIVELRPDVITLDLVMPNLDGIGVLEHLRERAVAPKVVVVTTTDAEGELALRALEMGAIDIVHKPTALATDRLYEMDRELVEKVRGAASARPRRHQGVIAKSAHGIHTLAEDAPHIVVIGASTGGPNALSRLLPTLPADISVPVVVVLHIPAGYTEALAARWSTMCEMPVVEAQHDRVLRAGEIVLAKAGMCLAVVREGDVHRMRLEPRANELLYCPSVDRTLATAAEAYEGRVLGVVLTGMGDDGLSGAAAVRAAGGQIVTEAEASCVVYGMPRVIDEAGLSNESAMLEDIGDAIMRRLVRDRTAGT